MFKRLDILGSGSLVIPLELERPVSADSSSLSSYDQVRFESVAGEFGGVGHVQEVRPGIGDALDPVRPEADD